MTYKQFIDDESGKALTHFTVRIDFPIHMDWPARTKIEEGLDQIKERVNYALKSNWVLDEWKKKRRDELRFSLLKKHSALGSIIHHPPLQRGKIVIKAGPSGKKKFDFIFYVNITLYLLENETPAHHLKRGRKAAENLMKKLQRQDWRDYY